ncbi:rho GTPase-activating protein 11B-like [Argonauta hians]
MEFFDLNNEEVQILRSYIVTSLRNNRIKVPKKSWNLVHAEYDHTSQTFGNYLTYVPFYPTEDFGLVPTFLLRAFEYIEKNEYFKMEGIFRRSGSHQRQKKVSADIEANMDFSIATLYDITDLVKTFFRKLKEPLLTNLYHDSFIQAVQHDDSKCADASLLLLCLLLPYEHLYTLRFLTLFLAKVASYSDLNGMTAKNLAVVLTPSIISQSKSKCVGNGHTDPLKVAKYLGCEIMVLEKLINNAPLVGVVPKMFLDEVHREIDLNKKKASFTQEIIKHLPCIC